MKTGEQTDMPKSRLTAKLEQMKTEQEDLMQSAMKSFVNETAETLENALNIIINDTDTLNEHMGQIVSSKLRWIRRVLCFSPWILLGTSLSGVAVLIGISLTWSWQMHRMEMKAFGLTKVIVNEQTYLVLNATKVRVVSCTAAGKPITCLEVIK